MHAIPELSSSLPHAQMVAIKKDAASQTECSPQVLMTNGRVVNCAHPSQSVCPDKIISKTDKSLSGYGVQFVKETLQAGLKGSNKLLGSVAGFASQHAMTSLNMMFMAAMPALAGAYPVSTRPACPDGAPGCSMTYTHSNGAYEASTSYTPSLANLTTNLTTTSEPAYLDGGAVLGIMFGVFAANCVLTCGFLYCVQVYQSCQALKRDNPGASNLHAIQAALKEPDYHMEIRLSPSDITRLPVPRPAQRNQAPTAPSTCEQGIQTEPMIDDPVPQEQQPPTYQEATADLENPQAMFMKFL